MKKKLIIFLIVLLIIAGVLVYLFVNKGQNSLSGNVKKNDPDVEKLVIVSQSEMSSFIFVTQESESDHVLNINLTPFLSFNIDEKEIESFKISNFKGINPKSEAILIPPSNLSIDTVSRTFLFTVQESIIQKDIVSDVDTIEYAVVSEVSKYNEVNKSGVITPYFGVIIKDIGRVNYKEIFDSDGIFDGGKYLEYSEIPLEELNTEIQFDIDIEFTDGSKYNKRFKGKLKGEAFATETSPMITLEVVE